MPNRAPEDYFLRVGNLDETGEDGPLYITKLYDAWVKKGFALIADVVDDEGGEHRVVMEEIGSNEPKDVYTAHQMTDWAAYEELKKTLENLWHTRKKIHGSVLTWAENCHSWHRNDGMDEATKFVVEIKKNGEFGLYADDEFVGDFTLTNLLTKGGRNHLLAQIHAMFRPDDETGHVWEMDEFDDMWFDLREFLPKFMQA